MSIGHERYFSDAFHEPGSRIAGGTAADATSADNIPIKPSSWSRSSLFWRYFRRRFRRRRRWISGQTSGNPRVRWNAANGGQGKGSVLGVGVLLLSCHPVSAAGPLSSFRISSSCSGLVRFFLSIFHVQEPRCAHAISGLFALTVHLDRSSFNRRDFQRRNECHDACCRSTVTTSMKGRTRESLTKLSRGWRILLTRYLTI